MYKIKARNFGLLNIIPLYIENTQWNLKIVPIEVSNNIIIISS